MNNKRHDYKNKSKKNVSKEVTGENVNYIDYLISNKILNTNAVTGEPTFQGYTSIYLKSNGVKVKQDNSKAYSSNDSFDELLENEESTDYQEIKLDDEQKGYDDNFDNLVENDNNTRNSEKDFVPLQEQENTEEKEKLDNMKEQSNKTDKVKNASKEDVKNLIKSLRKKGLKAGSSRLKKVFSLESNNEKYKALKEIEKELDKIKNNTETKC